MTLIVDIETVPLASALAAAYPTAERAHDSRLKDPAKIEQWYKDDEAKWHTARVKQCSLDPRLGRIVALGVAEDQGDAFSYMALEEAHEPSLLHNFWTHAEQHSDRRDRGPILVTFNGHAFDLPFLFIRSLACHVVPTVAPTNWRRRYSTWPHFDVRMELTGWDFRQEGTLHEWATFFDIPHSDDVSGDDIARLVSEGNWQAIDAHVRSDVNATKHLYQRVSPLFADTGGRFAGGSGSAASTLHATAGTGGVRPPTF